MSKALSLVLRHRPDKVGLTLEPGGWVDVQRLLTAMRMTASDLDLVVKENDKQRFAYDETGTRIRASQGHSVEVDLGLESVRPPETLYHGTSPAALDSILANGLARMNRHAVHLSADRETARKVGARRGRPVVLRVDSGRMADAGHRFSRSENGVWLTDSVPASYLAPEHDE